MGSTDTLMVTLERITYNLPNPRTSLSKHPERRNLLLVVPSHGPATLFSPDKCSESEIYVWQIAVKCAV